MERIFVGICVRVWMDAVHRPDSGDGPGFGGSERYDRPRGPPASNIFRRVSRSFPADGAGHWSILAVLSKLPKAPARRRTIQWRIVAVCGRAGFHQQADMACGEAELFEQRGLVATKIFD